VVGDDSSLLCAAVDPDRTHSESCGGDDYHIRTDSPLGGVLATARGVTVSRLVSLGPSPLEGE